MATAIPLSDLLGIPIHKREGLKEIAYGQSGGKNRRPRLIGEFHDDYVRWLADSGWNSPTGGEKGIDIARRSSEVLEEIDHNPR
jgi:probable phosphoglycerate mutase